MFDQHTFIDFMLKHKVVGTFEQAIQLNSGRYSNWYVNWRDVAQDAYALDLLCDQVLAFTSSLNLQVDTFYGVPEGASKLGFLCQYKFAKQSENFALGSHVLSMGRGKVKAHGNPKDQFFLGVPKGRTLVIEDVTTTGMSLVLAIKKLKEAQVDVVAAIALTNRMDDPNINVEKELAALGVPYQCLSTGKTIAQHMLNRHNEGQFMLSEASIKEFEVLAQS
ncbi:MAG TPA: hypothetical protein PKC21_05345 [Oligoflexia bacterium]|nr:hypothetical protein [Oligoflexia bacterium]HMR24761.1 hypothetical protein [Oligoflexia bacterium]